MADNNKKSNFSSLFQGEGRGEALITGAEALMRSLEHQGVKTIFGYPGGSIMPVFDALYDHRKELNHILVRHEQGATHAAQGFARVSGEVGVCLVTSGPGATNTITGIADAMIDSTPIVVIAGQVGTNFLGTDAFQEVDLVALLSLSRNGVTRFVVQKMWPGQWHVLSMWQRADVRDRSCWILLKTPKWRKQNMRLLRWTMSVAIFPFPK